MTSSLQSPPQHLHQPHHRRRIQFAILQQSLAKLFPFFRRVVALVHTGINIHRIATFADFKVGVKQIRDEGQQDRFDGGREYERESIFLAS